MEIKTEMTAEEFRARRKAKFRSRVAAAAYWEISGSLIEKYERGVIPIRRIHAMAFDVTLPRVEQRQLGE
ncbi:MAG TPA: hypothetical protein PLA50_18105 [Bacteroidia bacterium]|nr:hypothetical protein [Bacteroidia bacterium]